MEEAHDQPQPHCHRDVEVKTLLGGVYYVDEGAKAGTEKRAGCNRVK